MDIWFWFHQSAARVPESESGSRITWEWGRAWGRAFLTFHLAGKAAQQGSGVQSMTAAPDWAASWRWQRYRLCDTVPSVGGNNSLDGQLCAVVLGCHFRKYSPSPPPQSVSSLYLMTSPLGWNWCLTLFGETRQQYVHAHKVIEPVFVPSSLSHSLVQYLLSVYKVPEIVLGARDTELFKTGTVAILPAGWDSEGNT